MCRVCVCPFRFSKHTHMQTEINSCCYKLTTTKFINKISQFIHRVQVSVGERKRERKITEHGDVLLLFFLIIEGYFKTLCYEC